MTRKTYDRILIAWCAIMCIVMIVVNLFPADVTAMGLMGIYRAWLAIWMIGGVWFMNKDKKFVSETKEDLA